MARNTYRDDPAFLFELHFTLYTSPSRVTIRAFEGDPNYYRPNSSHTRIDVQMLWNGKEICKRGQTYCGLAGHHSIDGDAAKELATALFCDASYLEDDDGQSSEGDAAIVEWIFQHGESLSVAKLDRFGEV